MMAPFHIARALSIILHSGPRAPVDMTLYRGVAFQGELARDMLETYVPGRTLNIKDIISTSASATVAQSFTTSYGKANYNLKTLFVMSVPLGTPCRIRDFSEGEAETTLPNCTRWHVDKVHLDKGTSTFRVYMHLQALGSSFLNGPLEPYNNELRLSPLKLRMLHDCFMAYSLITYTNNIVHAYLDLPYKERKLAGGMWLEQVLEKSRAQYKAFKRQKCVFYELPSHVGSPLLNFIRRNFSRSNPSTRPALVSMDPGVTWNMEELEVPKYPQNIPDVPTALSDQ